MMKKALMFLSLFVLFALPLCGHAKEFQKTCSNLPPLISSHSFRYAISTNDSLRAESMTAHYSHVHDHHRHHEPGWADPLPRPRKMIEEYRKIQKDGEYSLPKGVLKPVSLHDVKLNPDSHHHTAQNTNLEYILMLDVDRLLWSFRKTAGLPTVGDPYGGWEAPYIELRGHFVGHYLSATAHMWASTHNEAVKENMDALVGNLSLCQKKMNTGYLSAFPTDLFDRVEALEFAWAPYYTVHKTMAGLLDQYTFGENEEALRMVTWMADYFYDRVVKFVEKHTLPRFYEVLNFEYGGMNDVLYRIYNFTGKSKYRTLAHLFDKPCFFGPLATKSDELPGLHANTHLAIVIGGQMRYELVGDPLYKELTTYFLDLVNSSHAFATGGTSQSEHWQNPDRIGDLLKSDTEESCSSYNMLKVARNLYRWTRDASYADYYERTLTNGVLSIQRGTEPGVMIYMFPQGRGVSKAVSPHGWGLKFDSFWCCYGTGIESFSKLGDSIYFEEDDVVANKDPSLYIAQYISSTFNWKAANFLLNMTVSTYSSYDPFVRVTFTFSPHQGEGRSSTLNLRVPTWTNVNDTNALLNNKPLKQRVNGGSYLTITRRWSASDNLTLIFPITPRLERIKDNRPEYDNVHAILYGPFLLVSHTVGNEWELQVSDLNKKPEDYLTAIPASNHSHLFTFSQDLETSSFVLTNLNVTDNKTLTTEKLPQIGTIRATHATFNLVLLDNDDDDDDNKAPLLIQGINDVLDKRVLLEPVHLPGRHLMHQGAEKPLLLSNTSANGSDYQSSQFRVVHGLDGRNGSVSIESVSNKGCFLYSGVDYSEGEEVKLKCKSGSSDINGTATLFNKAVSFVAGKGLKEYHPISFIAKGLSRSYLMEPIHSFADDIYTAYLDIHA
ncbi:uncharacterized protein LOC129302797 [Prosopis cineraria]|uniref:uncharacterized protein LOC129302797 n=1 Tax=Prosopis cineraria TaxID=364024 RepID=UPI00240ECF8E|nr:uncharacterized protein LOC129302797 [Prosopis cineraria]